ncbi:Mitogen-activated protein kinase kinase kinase [Bertholletia excelsa]
MDRTKKPNWVRGSCLGRGSCGSVSLAVGKSDGRVFAVKSVEQGHGSEPRVEALENEIRILQSISSPWVVGYIGDDVTVEDGGVLFRNLHLEYLRGGTVADVAKRSCGGKVDEGLVRSYTWCVVSALRDVHAGGIVHCDVKGRNVLVGPTAGAAKLADFGSATEVAEVVVPRGSPLWMAPEVVRGEYQGPESDVWSLGCTLIEMVTGKPAWNDCGADTLCRIGYSDQSPELPARLSELGWDFLDKCLQRDRSNRWGCDQLLQHPFISSSMPANLIYHPSPRCVLDWFSSDFSADDNESDEEEDLSSLALELRSQTAKQRIVKLASEKGANWESDGWMTVRNLIGEEEEGIISEYPNSTSTEREAEETDREYADSPTEMENLERVDSVAGDWLRRQELESGGGYVYGGRDAGCGSRERAAGGLDFLLVTFLYLTVVLCKSLHLITDKIYTLRSQSVHVTNFITNSSSAPPCLLAGSSVKDLKKNSIWHWR